MKYILSIGFILFFCACTNNKNSEDSSSENSEIENTELNSVDHMLKRDKQKLDSMEQVFKEQAESIQVD